VRKPKDLLVLPLLHYDARQVSAPWLSWEVWLEAMGLEYPAGARGLSFSHYDQLVQAAIAGQGVALGRFPLMHELVREGRLVTPLPSAPAAFAQGRGYWLIVRSRSALRPQVRTFVEWLRSEAASALEAQQPGGNATK
jgi:DNA-binding transcriptional LysR family regulator